MKKKLIIGHSHIHALQAATTQNDCFDFHQPNGLEIGALSTLNTEKYNSVFLSIDGNYHNVFGLINNPDPFDFYLPENPNLPIMSNSRVIPEGLIRKIMARDMCFIFNFTKSLCNALKNNTIIQIESPPPLPEEHIIKYPHPFQDKIFQLGISPAFFRYKLWRLHSSIVRENCTQLGIQYLEIPADSQDANGLLREQYCHLDATHANSLYGDLVLNQIRFFNSI